MKQKDMTQKLASAGLLTALAVAGSLLSVPVAGSRCAPVQHMVNILAAVTLGPWWGIGDCIRGESSEKPYGPWKPDGIPGEHGRGSSVRCGT